MNPEADLELVIGLSRKLPGIDLASKFPQIELCDDSGAVVETSGAKATDPGSNLQFDPSTSSSTLLVYRVQAPRSLPEKAYTPFLLLEKATIEAQGRQLG